MTSVSAVDPRV